MVQDLSFNPLKLLAGGLNPRDLVGSAISAPTRSRRRTRRPIDNGAISQLKPTVRLVAESVFPSFGLLPTPREITVSLQLALCGGTHQYPPQCRLGCPGISPHLVDRQHYDLEELPLDLPKFPTHHLYVTG